MAKITFLLVDNDRAALSELKESINTAFPDSTVHLAYDGIEGFDKVLSEHPSIVISDVTIPGYSGIELCGKIREQEELNDIFYIILTDFDDSDSRMEALKLGADDFLLKPVSPEGLVARLISASRYIKLKARLQDENKLLNDLAEDLEQDVKDMIQVCIKFLKARMPASTDMLDRVAKVSIWIAKHMDVPKDDLREIEIAANLSYAGKIGMPDDLLTKPILIDGAPSDKRLYQVPVTAREIVSSFTRFENISDILYYLFENFDGSGFPTKAKKWQIPIGSRIIRAALDYEESRFLEKQRPKKILDRMKNEANRFYDHRVVTLLEQYLAQAGEADSDVKERAVKLHELRVGMLLSRDVYTNSGLKLFTDGTVLSEKYIERILAHNTADPILGNIIIRVM